MDKYEYKVCLDDIKKSVQEKDFRRAAAIADTVEWRRVKSVKTLCMVSDIYKANQRYSESKDVLMLAYTRDPENGQILYALCDLELLLDDYLRAMQFYNKFVSISPRDPNRYILQYKLMEAQDVSLDERIAVLEELKKRTFKDRWVYELSNLYDRRGLYGRCAELCDELIAHGKPKYVRQALELKRTHSPLTKAQQDIYNRIMQVNQPVPPVSAQNMVRRPAARTISEETADTEEMTGMNRALQSNSGKPADFAVKPMDGGMASTVELQAAVAEGLREVMREEPTEKEKERRHEEKRNEVRREFRKELNSPEDTVESEEEEEEYRKAREQAAKTRARMYEEEENPDAVPEDNSEEKPAENPDVNPAENADTLPEAEEDSASETSAAEEEAAQPSAGAPEDVREEKKQENEAGMQETEKAHYDSSQFMQEAGGQFSMLIDEHHMPAPASPESAPKRKVSGPFVKKGVESWEKIRRRNDERHKEENIRKVEDTTGPIIAKFNEDSKFGVLEDIEDKAAQKARSERYREAVPEGEKLSDGMTEAERRHVDLTKPKESQENLGDTLVRDTDEMETTRVWSGEQIDQVSTPVRNYRSVTPPTDEMRGDPTARRFSEMPAAEPSPEEETAAEEETEEETAAAKEAQSSDSEEKQAVQEADSSAESGVEQARKAEKKEKLSETQEIAELVREELGEDDGNEKFESPADAGLSNRSIGAEAPAAAFGKTASADFASARYKFESPADAPDADPEEKYPESSSLKEIKPEPEEEPETEERRETEKEPAGRLKMPREPYDYAYPGRRAALLKENGPEEKEEDSEEDPEESQSHPHMSESERRREIARKRRHMDEKQASVRETSQMEEIPEEEPENTAPEPERAGDKTGPVTVSSTRGQEDKAAEDLKAERVSRSREIERIHAMSPEQKKMFGPFLAEKTTRSMLLTAIDEISLASYTGNVAVTGETGFGATDLAKALLRNVKMSDSNFSGKVAVTNGASINHKNIEDLVSRLEDGGLIIEKASAMNSAAVESLHRALEKEDRGLIVILTDGRRPMDRLFHQYPVLRKNFTCRVDIHPLSNDELVHLCSRYAERRGYSIDEMAVLALHSRIQAKQSIDHHVTAEEARVIVDEAIDSAVKSSPSHLMDSIFGKRKDEDGKVILREKDFSREG